MLGCGSVRCLAELLLNAPISFGRSADLEHLTTVSSIPEAGLAHLTSVLPILEAGLECPPIVVLNCHAAVEFFSSSFHFFELTSDTAGLHCRESEHWHWLRQTNDGERVL